MALSFKNVGIRKDESSNDIVVSSISKMPIGIKTPLQFSNSGPELLEMNFEYADQIKDNLKNLILTNFGDRVVQYKFGANLRPLLMEYVNKESFDQEAMININTAVAKFMPYVQLLDFESRVTMEQSQDKLKIVLLKINFNIPLLQINNQIIEVFLSTT